MLHMSDHLFFVAGTVKYLFCLIICCAADIINVLNRYDHLLVIRDTDTKYKPVLEY